MIFLESENEKIVEESLCILNYSLSVSVEAFFNSEEFKIKIIRILQNYLEKSPDSIVAFFSLQCFSVLAHSFAYAHKKVVLDVKLIQRILDIMSLPASDKLFDI